MSRARRWIGGATLAGALAGMLALGAAGVVTAQNRADTVVNPLAGDPAAPAVGKAIYEGACVVCHGADGTGGRGPALNTGRFARGGEDADLFKTIHDGIPGSGMPSFSSLADQDIWRTVAYIRSLSASPAAAQGGASARPSTGNVARGRTLFFGKGDCASCHEVNGRGLHLAADLSDVGARGPAAIREGLAHPPGRGANARRVVEATLPDGRMVTGLVRAEDSFDMLLVDARGELQRLDRRSLRSLRTLPGAAAPSDLATRLSEAEREDLVAYLQTQTARDVKGSIPPSKADVLPYARLVAAQSEPQNWLTYWGDYQGRHFSELSQIQPSNAGRLQARWAAQLPGPSALQATPLVVDGVMYVSGSPGEVYALDARTGLQIWKFTRKQDVVNPYQINPSNRGVAVLGGRVFVGTLDNLLIAIDARTGRALWERRIADTLEGYTITAAPLALKDRIVVGVSGGEYGLRGILDAYNPETGERMWRFTTIPGPGEPGNETWGGESWKLGGGGTWLTGGYDPELDQLYWTVGNPAPSFNPAIRPGDNLYTNSVVALDPRTGKLKWHYQFTPNDGHDWDSVQDLVLADRTIDGRVRKVMLHADRNGFFYTLDRRTGAFISGTPFVQQTWNDGFDARGRPRRRPESIVTNEPRLVYPAVGATNFQAPSFDHRSGVFYLAYLDAAAAIASNDQQWERGRVYTGGRRAGSAGAPEAVQGVKALDAQGRTLWNFPLARNSLQAGVLGTRGGVLFAAAGDGNLIALDMQNGGPLWRFQTGRGISASPIAYAVDGRQHVAIAAGNTVYSFALPNEVR